MAVVALGGYARRELCPASDIDLLLLHDGWGRTDLESAVQLLCYPLWDAGLSVGHAVRTPAEAVQGASDRIDVATALLDRRLVAGDPGLFDALTSRVQRWSRRHGRAMVVALAGADRARHERSGAYPGMLEPDLKNGAGGLRDIHSLRWAAGWVVGETSLDALVSAGYMGADDRHTVGRANEVLLRVRCALHASDPSARGRDVDVVHLQRQDQVAGALGLHHAGAQGDGDALLREVNLAARAVAHVHQRTWPLLLTDVATRRRRRRSPGTVIAPGIWMEAGLVEVAPDQTVSADAALPMRVVAAVAQHQAHLTRRAAGRLAAQLSDAGTLRWTADARAALLQTLGAPSAATALGEADHLGVLTAYLPEWERIRGRPQRNPLHRFDLDTHGANAVGALHALRCEPALAMLWEGIDEPDVVLLATWLHDVGKAWPGDHSEVGAEVAARWVAAMGFEAASAEQVGRLVRLHLLLPDVATRRDLDDPAEIEQVADRVSDAQSLDALYLLSLADGRATGPAAWSTWKDSLMARLHALVRARLGAPLPRVPGPRAVKLTVQQRAALEREAPEEYLADGITDQSAAHAQLLLQLDRDSGLRAGLRPGFVAGTTVLSVVAKDRPGLVADCAGVLAAHRLNVVEARALTGPRGVALDWFTIDGDAPPAVLGDLQCVYRGERSVEDLLARRRQRGARGAAEAPEITVHENVVEVRAPDAPGLLYRLCRTMTLHGLNVRAARISSLGMSVFDVFEVSPGIPVENRADLRNALYSAALRDN